MAEMVKLRKEIAKEDTWNLEILYKSTVEWEQEYNALTKKTEELSRLEGTINADTQHLRAVFQTLYSLLRETEKLNAYVFLKYSEDSTNTLNQKLFAQVQFLQSSVTGIFAIFQRELTSLPDDFLNSLLEDKDFSDYKKPLFDMIRSKPHLLSISEEKILAKQSLYMGGFQKSFSALIDSDLRFGTIATPEGEIEITHSTVTLLLEHEQRNLRKEAFEKYHAVLNEHVHVLSQLYTGSVQQDCISASIRKFSSALESSVYPDNIPVPLYQTLITSCRSFFDELHDYYAMLKEHSKLENFAVYDTRAPFFERPPHNMSYDSAISLICEALAPLGEEYIATLHRGLSSDRWVDKYENRGKHSGAFSCSVYDSYPYILLNYQPKSLEQVFTIAHEAGHSMHSYYSNKENPYPMASYTIFEAEVASTVNEFLLYQHIIKNTENEAHRAYFLWHEIQNFVSVFFRQVMFAEFELRCHEQVEKNKALSSDYFLSLSKKLLAEYYGPAVSIPAPAQILGLRIPHFYRPFYVFKYATGISAAYAIASQIDRGENTSLAGYFDFLKSGGSRYPLDSLKLAGVDFHSDAPIRQALNEFKKKKDALKALIS